MSESQSTDGRTESSATKQKTRLPGPVVVLEGLVSLVILLDISVLDAVFSVDLIKA